MTTATNTVGATIGSLIGKSAAYGVHGVVRVAVGTGRFGADVVAGASTGYTSKAAELAAARARLAAARGNAPIAITVTASPAAATA